MHSIPTDYEFRITSGQVSPSGQELMNRMLRAVWSKGTHHMRMEAIDSNRDFREVLRQDIDEDLQHCLMLSL
jgi:hypothetical protein